MEKKERYMVSFLLGMGITVAFLLIIQQKCINRWKGLAEKNKGLFLLVNAWVKLKQDGKKLESYFIKNDLKRIAIYGMSNVGMCLLKELKDSEIEVLYGIDRNAADIYSEIKVVTLDNTLQEVDAVVVTLLDGFEEVYEVLSGKLSCPIIAIEDIINEI